MRDLSLQLVLLALYIARQHLCSAAPTNSASARNGGTNSYFQQSSTVELTAYNLTSNLEFWNTDLAIMFYAPWCKYCKQLNPSWEQIAKLSKNNANLIVGKFNCESPADNADLCQYLNVDRYPSVLFIGYGSFHQGAKGSLFGVGDIFSGLLGGGSATSRDGKVLPAKAVVARTVEAAQPRVVRFVSDLYPDALYEWVGMLSFMSSLHRFGDTAWELASVLTGSAHRNGRKIVPKASEQLAQVHSKMADAERKVGIYAYELEKYKAYEIFDQLEDHGDVFPIMHELAPDEKNLPLRICVAQMAEEYCKFAPEESYCATLPQCAAADMEPVVCRPAKCPFASQRGCVVTSACMQADVIEQYKKALAKAAQTATQTKAMA